MAALLGQPDVSSHNKLGSYDLDNRHSHKHKHVNHFKNQPINYEEAPGPYADNIVCDVGYLMEAHNPDQVIRHEKKAFKKLLKKNKYGKAKQ